MKKVRWFFYEVGPLMFVVGAVVAYVAYFMK